MTTEIKLLRASDLFIDNEVFLLGGDARAPDIKLGGAAWIIARQPVKAAHMLALQRASALALSKLDGYSLWLLAGHQVWQPESRITRYRNLKLWGAFKSGHLEIPFGHDMGEYPVEAKNGLHYFGALQLGLGSIEPAVAILEAESLSHLVALHPKHSAVIDALIRTGWQLGRYGRGPSWDVLKAVSEAAGVVFWCVGAFDDIEAGTVAFAEPSVIERLLG